MMGPARHTIQIDADIDQKIIEHTLFLAVQYAYGMDVKGDVVEFGTMTGSSAAVLALAIAKFDQYPQPGGGKMTKDLYLLDSFEGFPAVEAPEDANSPHVKDGRWGAGRCVDMSAEQLAEAMATILPAEKVHISAGWFRDTAWLLTATFACIHVDCDLFESTIDALTPLFERGLVAEGAIILFDDWNGNRADPRFGERAAWARLCADYEIRFSDEGGYGMSGHKFICHGYRP